MTAARTLASDYDVYEVAYLAGGPRRVVDTAVVALVETARLSVAQPTGELTVVDHRRRHAVEAAVLDAVGLRGHRSIDTVRWRVVSDDRMRPVRERLERDGLLRPGAGTGVRQRNWRVLSLTREGRRTLRTLRSEVPADRVAGGTSAMLVALVGPGRMADRDLRGAVFAPPRPPRARGRLAPRGDGYAPTYHGWFGGGGDAGGFGGGSCGDGGGGDGGGGDGGGGC